MIVVNELRKQFGQLVAAEDVSFTAKAGQIFGLLGPNGAGKSTTINCIAGLLTPTSGTVSVKGHDVVSDPLGARRTLGVVPQELALYEDLSARENLRFWGGAYGLRGQQLEERVNTVLSQIGLQDRAGDKPENYSGGMKRRLNFGCGIVHQPDVLLLDEPTVGVDPQSRERLLERVRDQVARGACVLYTTHYMEEAEALCDQLVIMDHGKIIASGTMDELREMMGERDVLRVSGRFDGQAVRKAFDGMAGVEVLQVDADVVQLSAETATRRLPELLGALAESGADIQETTLARPNLESLFLLLTGKALRE
ncbi:MAG: ABC transporter ATP-binding protein [Gammaproteobacteria bacterium]|nr:ABC transporter ATP-binding protein [Gammaproteobacteria bacterium]